MSVNSETSAPTPRVLISVTETPAPPWTQRVFQCQDCGMWWQLEAGDQCSEIDGTNAVLAPACWRCGHVNMVTLPELEVVANPS